MTVIYSGGGKNRESRKPDDGISARLERLLAVQPTHQRPIWRRYFETMRQEADDGQPRQPYGEAMFTKIGRRTINTARIREIQYRKDGRSSIVLDNDETVEAEAWEIAAINWPMLPAQPGYAVMSTMLDGQPSNSRALREELFENWVIETVVAWQVHPSEGLKPMTANPMEHVRNLDIDDAIVGPRDEIRTATGDFFRSSKEWFDSRVTEKARELGLGDTGDADAQRAADMRR